MDRTTQEKIFEVAACQMSFELENSNRCEWSSGEACPLSLPSQGNALLLQGTSHFLNELSSMEL